MKGRKEKKSGQTSREKKGLPEGAGGLAKRIHTCVGGGWVCLSTKDGKRADWSCRVREETREESVELYRGKSGGGG